MLSLRLVLAALLVAVAVVKAYVVAPLGAIARSATPLSAERPVNTRTHTQTCICMACRHNSKKEKRLRNRINAFRFKKQTYGFNKFNNFADRNAQKANEQADGEWLAQGFTASAEAEAAEAAEAAETQQ
mmetsp:Transcript_45886/g.99807  ORF Transcript_45886/g.99807 Transcript_45886/m.99807 type:complete len:129 (-) Transcript_45886:359-745(-)